MTGTPSGGFAPDTIETLRAELERVEADRRSMLVQIQEQDRLYAADLATAQARVAKLEDACDLLKRAAEKRGTERTAAESALASARKLLDTVRQAWAKDIRDRRERMFVEDGFGISIAELCKLYPLIADLLSTTPTPAPSEPPAVVQKLSFICTMPCHYDTGSPSMPDEYDYDESDMDDRPVRALTYGDLRELLALLGKAEG